MSSLTRVKLLHTFIWAIMAVAILYIFYSGLTGDVTNFTWIAVLLALGECGVILLNRWTCPLTQVAAKHTDSREPNFDIYLPRRLAEYNKELFGTILAIGILLLIVRLVA